MARLINGIRLFFTNPSLFAKRIFLEITSRPGGQRKILRKKINGVEFEFDFGFDPSIKLMYHEVYEVDIVDSLRRFLKPGDTFVDVGANIGYLSAVAAGVVGVRGAVHSFEPVPAYFSRLQAFSAANTKFKIVTNQCALGESETTSTIDITNLSNIGWNTLVPGMMSKATVRESISVPVMRLDRYLREQKLDQVAMIKIDTEGYEFPVLKGLSGFFEGGARRPVLMIEVAPSAYPFLGATLVELRDYLHRFGYSARSVHTAKAIDLTTLKETTNVLFLHSAHQGDD